MADIYIVNKEDLQQVADKIREKNGTSDPIVFPDGFVSSIDAVYNSGRSDVKNIIERTVTEIEDDSVETVGEYAFYKCSALTSVNFPNLKSIGDYAFYACANLVLQSLPEGITFIPIYAFWGCRTLSITSLPEGVTGIGNGAFRYCTNLVSMTLPQGVNTVGTNAFTGCSSLTNVIFKGTPTYLATTAFSECTDSLTINVPWAEGEVEGAPWGADSATINYNYTEEE